MGSKNIRVHGDEAYWDAVDKIVIDLGTSRAALVKEAVDQYLKSKSLFLPSTGLHENQLDIQKTN